MTMFKAQRNNLLSLKYFNVHTFLSLLFTKYSASLKTASSCLQESYEEKLAHRNCGCLNIHIAGAATDNTHMEVKQSSELRWMHEVMS